MTKALGGLMWITVPGLFSSWDVMIDCRIVSWHVTRWLAPKEVRIQSHRFKRDHRDFAADGNDNRKLHIALRVFGPPFCVCDQLCIRLGHTNFNYDGRLFFIASWSRLHRDPRLVGLLNHIFRVEHEESFSAIWGGTIVKKGISPPSHEVAGVLLSFSG